MACCSASGGLRFIFLLQLLLHLTTEAAVYIKFSNSRDDFQRQRFDGWYNNKGDPDLGCTYGTLLFDLPIGYADMTYMPSGSRRPSARLISNELFKGKPGQTSHNGRTAMFAYFGEFITTEVAHTYEASCPVEILNVKVPKCDPDFDDNCTGIHTIPYERITYEKYTGLSPNNPRKQINYATSFIDGSVIYGSNEVTANILREWESGRLKASDPWHRFPALNTRRLGTWRFPMTNYNGYPDPTKFWQFGDSHVHENPGLLSLSLVFYRWHNYLVEEIQTSFNEMSAENVFYKARAWVTATLQNIIFYEWLPKFLNETMEPYKGYNSKIDPRLSAVYDAVVMNYYLTLMPSAMLLRQHGCKYETPIRFCNSFWKGQEYLMKHEDALDKFLLGMVSQLAEKDDMVISHDFKGKLYGTLYYSLQDRVVQIIMKGRDYGLPDYNTARVSLGMERIKDWKDINPELAKYNPELINKMESVHKSLDNIDIFTGAMMETTEYGPGELVKRVTKEQFLRIRDGDRFWFENTLNGIFTKEEVAQIRNITMADLIKHVTDIDSKDLQEDVFTRHSSDPCKHPPYINESQLPSCPELKGYDFFSGSEISFIATWIAIALVPGVFLLLSYTLGWYKRKLYHNQLKKAHIQTVSKRNLKNSNNNIHTALEWLEYPSSSNRVEIELIENGSLDLWNNGKVLRSVSFKDMETIQVSLSINSDRTFLLIKVPKFYDLILQFAEEQDRLHFTEEMEKVIKKHEMSICWNYLKQKDLLESAITRKKRNKVLEKFLKSVFSEAFHLDYDPSLDEIELHQNKEMLEFEMSKCEFAEALALKIDSDFVQRMFSFADVDNKNYISFRDFLNIVVIFTKGGPRDKLSMLFHMYDLDSSDDLDRFELTRMFKTLLDMGKCELDDQGVDALVESIIQQTGLGGKAAINFEEFCTILSPQMDKLLNCSIAWKTSTEYFPAGMKNSETKPGSSKLNTTETHELQKNFAAFTKYSPIKAKMISLKHFIENNKQHIFFIITLYTFSFGVFAERFYYYSVQDEDVGLRRMMGFGLSLTRGAAASMSFNFSLLLLTMCRNTITWLRGTFLNMYIPFDSNIAFHKLVAWTALFFTAAHVIGYGFNFYHVATQPSKFLCVFRNMVFRSDFVPKFHWWVYGNITGMTGVLLTILIVVIYVFATQQSRRFIFHAFWLTHKLIIPLYILIVLHGSAVVVQKPLFWVYFIGPAILFTIDKMVSLSRKSTEISVMRAEKLPSDVTYIEFKRPTEFDYKSGQWVKIACLSIGPGEFHPFTLTSAPHEDTLSVHVRALGPWTSKIREIFDPMKLKDEPYPKLYVDGPYGAGQQDWYRFEVAILVGAGIGVTPYASILKDFVKMSAIKNTYKVKCQKLYFIWVTGSHRHFEWLIDILREVEEVDTKGIVTIDIFITKFFQKFDLRTAMLFICEEYFQKLSNGRSVFTGLKAKTHFGRPQLSEMMQHIHMKNPQVRNVGVFSCGPHGITKSVEKACNEASKTTKALFKHHHENF